MNTDIRRPDCTSITKREREGRRERAGQTEGGEACMILNTDIGRPG